ncbi:LPS-assembly protein LptD [Citreimonas salinaria]|uniref:LPS-assembly protein LptD n=1 Tax=Citreimonas salinaria TaxID=321339 RepID=A0A1H3GZV1_9RHOB|nr:LPS assembly protein LptD [Citreimonas salinaria]SDY08853.1 LPS-assembly protein [Citreimonas salinaria]
MRLILAFAALLALGLPARAQQDRAVDAAILVADTVLVENDSRLIASGNVEALSDGTRLQASRVVYDQEAGLLSIEGPIRITDESGRVTILASAAELDEGFRNGLLAGARIVLDDQLQLAAVEARRVDGRYNALSRVAVTSCQICAGRAPLWSIRASRVVHDQLEQQIYFDDAQLRVLDVPVFYLPRLRVPDPTLERARGFLFPTLRSSTLLGFGIKIPYFIPIGDHQDVTLTPYLSSKTRTLEFRYRRAFVNGDLLVNGAVSRDTRETDEARGYLFAEGAFTLPRGFTLDFDAKLVTDAAYLNDYGITGTDRLDSTVTLTRARRDSLFQSALVHYQSLREAEDNDTQPTIVGDIRYQRRYFPALIGGEIRVDGIAHGHYRYSSTDIDTGDSDDVVDGRDLARLNAAISWRDRWTLPLGLRAGVSTHLWLDHFEIRQDATSPERVSAATPGVAVDLRWPFARGGAGGSRTLVEPVVQLGWVGGTRPENPNDESTRVEFDEANLLSLSRFPAADRREHGATLAAGLRMMHRAPAGWTAALTIGQVWRDEADEAFTRSSGLQGETSDTLIAGRFASTNGLSISARGLLDDTARISKAEARAAWSNDRIELGASYVLLVTDTDEERDEAQSEWTLDAAYQVTPNWLGSTEWRYDLAGQRLDRVGLGLQYRTRCVEVGLSATRRYASSANVEPSTDFDLSVALLGFSTGGPAKEIRPSCS